MKSCVFTFVLSQGIFWFYIWSLHWPNAFIVACCLFSTLVLFPFSLIYLISSFIPLFGTKILDKLSILLQMLKLVFWSNMWSIVTKISCALQKNIYSAVLHGMSYRSLLSSTSLICHLWPLFLFNFLYALSLDVGGLLKSSTVNILLPISPLYVYAYLLYIFRCSTFGAYMLIIMAFYLFMPLSLYNALLCLFVVVVVIRLCFKFIH